MDERESPPLDAVFHALGDGTRREMLRRLAEGERTVGDLAAPFPMSLAAASKHIKVLERAGLVRRDIRWREHWCSLDAAPLHAAQAELAHYARFWTDRLDDLERLIRDDDATPDPTEGEHK